MLFSTLQTPLIIAAKNGHLKCVKVLLAHKCDLYSTVVRNSREMYSWDVAIENNHAAVSKYLKGCVGMSLPNHDSSSVDEVRNSSHTFLIREKFYLLVRVAL